MSKSLVLHVGLQKTATTYLQKEVFPFLEGVRYIEKPSIVKKAFCLSPLVWSDSSFLSEIDGFLLSSGVGEEEVVLFSDENLAAPRFFPFHELKKGDWRSYNRQDVFLFAEHLKALLRCCEALSCVRLKVLITVRKQWDLLASLYAQSSKAHFSGQKNFEAEVAKILSREERYYLHGFWLDYNIIHRYVASVVGVGNVLVLPQEELVESPGKFFGKLGRFVGAGDRGSLFGSEGMTYGTGRSEGERNVRRGSGGWKLRRRSSWLGAGKSRRDKSILKKLLPNKIWREGSIVLTYDTECQVREFYSQCNRDIDIRLNLGLKRLGYY